MDNLENDKLNIATKIKLGSTQVKNIVNISNVEEDNKITKVLTVSAKPIIENISVNNASVKFDGVVDYDLLVVLENNEIKPLTQKTNFSQVFEDTKINVESIINIYTDLLELNNVSSANGISYSAVINFDIYLVEKNLDVNCAKPIENVFVKEGEISFNSFVNNVVYDSTVNFELAKDSKINQILFTNNYASIKSVIPSNDYFVVSGEVYSSITFQSEDGLIKSTNKTTTFSEEIECVGVNKDSIIQAQIKTKESTVLENTEKGIFSFDVPIQILAQIYNKTTVKCVVDAYSLQNEVNLITKSYEEDDFVSSKQIEENILTNFAIAENIPLVDKILSVMPINISVVNQIIKDKELLIEGIAVINIIYYFEDEEGNNILNSLDVEVPYSINLNIPELSASDKIILNVVLGDINIKNKRSKELEILAEVKINYDIIKNNISAITTDINLGEEKPIKDYALEIYLAKEGQTLWDIAKELNISTTDLVNQNSDLTLPISNGEKIVAYKQRIVDFE